MQRRKSRHRKLRRRGKQPSSMYRGHPAAVPSPIDAASQTIEQRLSRIEANYELLDQMLVEIEVRARLDDVPLPPIKPR
jgi:hypothetical protein